jgi:hypothetical protein
MVSIAILSYAPRLQKIKIVLIVFFSFLKRICWSFLFIVVFFKIAFDFMVIRDSEGILILVSKKQQEFKHKLHEATFFYCLQLKSKKR